MDEKANILKSYDGMEQLRNHWQGVRMKKPAGAKIVYVEPDSIGERLGLEPGDVLLKMNRMPLLDRIDYLMLCSEENLQLEVVKPSGEMLDIEFEKDPSDFLGITFEDDLFDGIRTCTNHCIFCFVHQMPLNQRGSLYIKDDDYRLSFLQGGYITLTNLTETDWQRIEKWRLSPLYISVHATEPEVRTLLLGSKRASNIMQQLRRLAAAGITLHTQAVICPGINDGAVLTKTIQDLAELWPAVASLAVVPVGLTKERRNLFSIEPFDQEGAGNVLEIVERFQIRFLETMETRFVYAADEWYITAQKEFPGDDAYEEYWQLDNGVGLVRRFLTDFQLGFTEHRGVFRRFRCQIIIVTGRSTRGLWSEVHKMLAMHCPDLHLEILDVPNQFFGPTVTVTGLLAGEDIIHSIESHPASPEAWYLVPQVTLKRNEDLFLDGVSVEKLKAACHPKQVAVVPTGAAEWLEWMIENKRLFT
jgi:putative radical SAM enzyme (TIGR03279 family)